MENTANNHNAAEHGGDSAWAQALRNVAIFAESGPWTPARVDGYKQWLQGQLALCKSYMHGFVTSIDDELWRREYDTGSDSEEYKLDIGQLEREYAEHAQQAEVLTLMIEMLSLP